MTTPITGGCQCGRIRYSCTDPSRDGYYCHCRMCQRAVGHVAAAFWNVTKASVTFEGAEPDHFASSPIGRRGFCAACGTPLTFDYPDSARMDLTVGSLDDPAAIALTSHFGAESRVPGWIAEDGLPATRCEEYQPLADRWAGVRGGPE